MEITRGFYDLCIPYNKDENALRRLITELVELGYRTIAIDQIFDHSKKDTIKRGSEIFPIPCDIKTLQNEFLNKIKILQRLTIIYTDVGVAHAMTNSLNLKKFNIIAGQPKTDAALTHCCTAFGGDIVTFDPEGAKPLINRKNYQVAVKRGMFFEIKYSLAISNSMFRKDMIKIAHNYNLKGKSKNIVFSSGATNIFELRGPYDVSNLGFIFGLSEDQGKSSIGRTCRQLILKAESRRLGKTIMFVKNTGPICFSSSESEDEEEGSEDASEDDKPTTGTKSSIEDPIHEAINEQPNKKKKLC